MKYNEKQISSLEKIDLNVTDVCERCIYYGSDHICTNPNCDNCYGYFNDPRNQGIPRDIDEFFKILGEKYYFGDDKDAKST